MNTGRKTSGGKYHTHRKKKHYERKGQEKVVLLKENKSKKSELAEVIKKLFS